MSGAGPSLFPGEPPSWTVLKFPPKAEPATLPPPYDGPSLRTPFPIPTDIFNAALSYKVPLTIATVYATTVVSLNAYNRRNGNKPWAISKTKAFKAFVILHNVFLAVYSAITCYAVFYALKRSLPHYTDHNAFIRTVDALCKINGPRGLGRATAYNPETDQWYNRDSLVSLDHNGLPPTTDVGRLWNEGLAWWGWWFYLSKFYEVLDTAIILAKGKRSSTLQTYHHTGAMLCMWAGIRYMSPPIWMFCLINSGIHALMYTYYTVSALGIRVPQAIKRTLTTCQIMQFLVGFTFAVLHLFVVYTVPVSVPYKAAETITSAASSLVNAVTDSAAAATATGASLAILKKLVYRAAGEEGLAENVPLGNNAYAAQSAVGQADAVPKDAGSKTVYRTEYQAVPCIDTSGEAFAVYLNAIYLAPLTFLFVRFFVKSYLRRTSPATKRVTKNNVLVKSGADAVHGINKELDTLGKAPEDLEPVVANGAAPRGGVTSGNANGHANGGANGVTTRNRKAAAKA